MNTSFSKESNPSDTDEIDLAFENGDYSFVFEAVRHSASAGDPKSQTRLGTLYALGKGVKHDLQTAFKWFLLAAEQGYPYAQFAVGRQLYSGEGVAKDTSKAVSWFRLSAEQGTVQGQYSLGMAYEGGEGIEKNINEAIKWYQLAVDHRDKRSQFRLGYLYLHGDGITQNIDKAISLITMSANQGYAEAQLELALLYLNFNKNKFLTKDISEAMRWCRLAVAQGKSEAKVILTYIYKDICGVVRSLDTMGGTVPSEATRIVTYSLAKTQSSFGQSQQYLLKRLALGKVEIEVAERLYEQIMHPDNFLKAIDIFEKNERIIAGAIYLLILKTKANHDFEIKYRDLELTEVENTIAMHLSEEMEKPDNAENAIRSFRRTYVLKDV
jgi:TPR repeat protein